MSLKIPLRSFGKPLAWYHRWFWHAGRIVVWLLGGRRDSSMDTIPLKGPAVVVAPHLSFLDPLFLAAALPRPARFIAASFFLTRHPILSWLSYLGAVIPVQRQRKDPSAVRKALRLLACGELVAFFPEGGRSWTGVPNLPMTPAAKLLAGLKVPIYVATFDGSFDCWPRFDPRPRLRRVRVRVLGPLAISGDPSDRAPDVQQPIPHWWSDVYSRGRRGEVERAAEKIRSHLGSAAATEPDLLRLDVPGRMESLARILCFCPGCASASLIFDRGVLTCRSCGLSLRGSGPGQLQWIPAYQEPAKTFPLHEVVQRMVSRLEAASSRGFLLQERVKIGEAPQNPASTGATTSTPALAWLNRAGLCIQTNGHSVCIPLRAVAASGFMGSETLETTNASDGTIVYVRAPGGAMRILLAARAYLGLPFDSMNL